MLKNADNAVERVNDKNEAIHSASPVHSQQEHIATGLALCKDICSPAIHRASPVYSQTIIIASDRRSEVTVC